jgi:hypothetical protein
MSAIGLLMVLCLLASPPALPLVWYVDADATGANNGAGWDDAFVDLQSALDVATSGNVILIAGGKSCPASSRSRATP